VYNIKEFIEFLDNIKMFISSMARKNKRIRSKSAGYSNRTNRMNHSSNTSIDFSDLPDVGEVEISRTSLSSGVMISGSRQFLREKGRHYRTNSEKTIRPSSSYSTSRSNRSSSRSKKLSVANEYSIDDGEYLTKLDRYNNFQQNENTVQHYPSVEDFSNDLSENQSDWYLDPMHRRTCRSFVSSLNETHQDTFKNNENIEDIERNMNSLRLSSENLVREKTKVRNTITPYEMDLYRLRYEKLKLEEAYLLKLKCEAELERTRGPAKKWYELKTKEFTTEMEKYQNLLKHKNNWQDLINYRNDLLEISGEWSNLRH